MRKGRAEGGGASHLLKFPVFQERLQVRLNTQSTRDNDPKRVTHGHASARIALKQRGVDASTVGGLRATS